MKSKLNLDQVLHYAPTALKIVAGFYIGLFLLLALIRLWYPFELEWMEGHSLEQVQRILTGYPLFVPPTLNFIPFIYAPLYYYFSAFLAFFMGANFVPLRLLSLLAASGTMALLYLIVMKETNNRLASILAVGLFAGTYRLSGAWLDLARVDSLFLFWLILTIYLLRFTPTLTGYVLAGVSLVAAALTKQSTLIFLLPLWFAVWGWQRRLSYAFLFSALFLYFTNTWLLNYWHAGWYNFYLLDLPARHRLDQNLIWQFWQTDLLYPLAITCGFILLYWWLDWFKTPAYSSRYFYPLVFLGLFLLALTSRINVGAYNNALLPLYAGLAMLFGLAFHHLYQFMAGEAKSRKAFSLVLIYIFCCLQFLALFYSPWRQLPSRDDHAAGKKLLQILQQIDGPILILAHGYLARSLGKPSFTHQITLAELMGQFGGEGTVQGQQVLMALKTSLENRAWTAVLLDSPLPNASLQQALNQNYTLLGRVFKTPDVFWPVTGFATRPEFLYRVQGSAAPNPLEEYHPAMPEYLKSHTTPSPRLLPTPETLVHHRILKPAAGQDAYALLVQQGIEAALRQDLAQAQHYWLQARQLDAHRPEARANLGVLYERLGDYSQALLEYAYAAQHLGQPWQQYHDQLQKRLLKK